MSPGERPAAVRPWGWWLRSADGRLDDGKGGRWFSVREAFWTGELGFPDFHCSAEQQEMLLRVLAAVDARGFDVESKHDIFAGDMMAWRFYVAWLFSIGLVESGRGLGVLDAPLTEKGRSVLLMLQATREHDWTAAPFERVRAAADAAGRGEADGRREEALRCFEAGVAHLPVVFARERIGRAHAVTLTSLVAHGRMPTRRVVWTQGFGDAAARDDLFAWIAERLDRWEDWGEIAYARGAHALTQHLLGLVMLRRGGGDAGRA